MGDHMAVFRSLRELFPQVDPRMLKAVAIEHCKDADSAVLAVLDEVMPSMTGSVGIPSFHHEAALPMEEFVRNLSANHGATGSSSSAGPDARVNEANGSVDSAQVPSSTGIITDMQEIVLGELDVTPPYKMMSEQLHFPSHHVLELNDEKNALIMDELLFKFPSENNLVHSDNPIGYIVQSPMVTSRNDSINLNAAQVQEQDSDIKIPVGDCVPQDYSLKKFHSDCADIDSSIWLKIRGGVSNSEASPEIPSIEKDDFAPVLDFSVPYIGESSVGAGGVLEQKDTNYAGIDYNKQHTEDRVEHGDTFLSSKTNLLPDLNLNPVASMASTHSSHSISIKSLKDSIVDAKNKKNDLLPSLELVTKMIGDVELLEEKAELAKRDSSSSCTSILTKVEELKEMLNHAKEANDMHAGEVFGERSILTTEARELQSRLQRLSDERNSYLVVIEEIRQTLEERLVAAQQEIESAEKVKVEKEASAQALLSEQEDQMNSIVEESRKLQKEAEENLKLKDFLVERGRIVDTLQGEMAVICEDVSQLKRIVDERLSWSKLQRSTISSLSSSLHSSLHRSDSSLDRTIEAVESTDKHTVAEGASPVEDTDVNERMVEMLADLENEVANPVVKGNSKKRESNEEGWEFC
ncbi:uncharacterized protein LOC100838996 [Brachypodium distachyon]|uniref:CUE domain-containing protein n=1 Tax=Brachypodium distachyon TaxID=15368 RepID=I1HJH1_BRADI|nr:uncharacterized protein LOC100838996 [Brachypodium distachyon]KQK06287.1 hypothetical protein BRADI_2g25520v3 [Brachypodium distachyon]|eukprot:XP_014754449.1 uncharacterized protein LOC100838996 [Brachypodium distachyon]